MTGWGQQCEALLKGTDDSGAMAPVEYALIEEVTKYEYGEG
jgi:hypothetical protein